MNKIKIIFGSIIFLGIFLLGFEVSFAGCCVQSSGSCADVDGLSNCNGSGTTYLQTDCNEEASKTYCKPSTDKPDGVLPVVDANVGLEDKKGSSGSGAVSFTNPLQFNTVEELLTKGLLAAIQSIIVVLALVFIAIGAIMILVSAGSPETVEKGKKTIYMAIIGLALGIGAPSIMKEIGTIIGWSGADTTALSLSQIALNVLDFLLGITGVLAIIMLVVGGIMYLTSAGDEERVESGKKIFKFSLIGIIVIMISMIIVKQIARFFAVS